MCLWFVRANLRHRRMRMILEFEMAANQPAYMTEDDMQQLPVSKYVAVRACVSWGVGGCVCVSVVWFAMAQKDGHNETCAVCLTDFTGEDDVKVLPCRHMFHPRMCLRCQCPPSTCDGVVCQLASTRGWHAVWCAPCAKWTCAHSLRMPEGQTVRIAAVKRTRERHQQCDSQVIPCSFL